jgi:hypothetical protein
LILSVLIVASASTVSASKDYLRNAPLLAGSVIKYCEKHDPKACETIDRQKEVTSVDRTKVAAEVALKLTELYPDFSSLSVCFSKSEDVHGSFDMTFDAKQGAK